MITAGATAVELIPGDPREPEGLAAELDRYAHGADEAAARLRALDDGIWFGEAAEAFRAALAELPARLSLGTEAFGVSARALRHYAEELRSAQATAGHVAELAAQARQQSAAYERQVADYQAAAAAGAPAGPAPPPVDPGAETMAAAERMLAVARERVDGAAQFATNVLQAQAEQAPDQRSIWESAWHYFSQFWIGVGEGIWGLGTFVYHCLPTYAIVDPQGFVDHYQQLLGGLAYTAYGLTTHPVAFVKTRASNWWEAVKENPARELGHLFGGGLVGGGVAKGFRAARRAGQTRPPEGRQTTGGQDSRRADEVGAARERKVAEITGGRVAGEPGKPGMKVTEPGVGTTDVDVIGPHGEYIAVGGPAKIGNIQEFGRHVRVLKHAADEAGVPAQYYFEEGTPQRAINVAERRLGEDNVFVFER